ncbi:MAG: hypothetical protein C5B52_00360 [Bacteroidetes bacterium]|nr:MAG: hypothetical protein C5B52_00360 [Bacteroidota bacterium]
MTLRIFRRNIARGTWLYDYRYIDSRGLYAFEFNLLPCVATIDQLDVTRAYEFVRERYQLLIGRTYQHTYFDYDTQNIMFNSTIVVMKDRRLLEIAVNACLVLYASDQLEWARRLILELADFRVAEAPKTRTIGFNRQTESN